MKRIIALVLAIAMITGCSSTPQKQADTKKVDSTSKVEEQVKEDKTGDEVKKEDKKDAIKVERNKDVEIKFPASMVGTGEQLEATIKSAKEKGVKEIIKNDDGTLTYKMSGEVYDTMMKELKQNIQSAIDEIKNNEDIKSIKEIITNDDFSDVTLVVDRKAYEGSFDGMAALGVIFGAMMYQSFDGKTAETMKVNLNVKDASTNEVFDSTIYPDAFNKKE